MRATTRDGDIVLDSFAGTGTTGHATLGLNKDDNTKRRFVLIEMDQDICADITSHRLRMSVEGYSYAHPKSGRITIPGLGGGFRYCTLGKPLFREDGSISADVSFADLAAHIHFSEFGEPIPSRPSGKSPVLNVRNGIALCLLFNGILGDRSLSGGNVLTSSVLNHLPAHNGTRVIYGEGCRLGTARLRRENIVFKQIPYDIKVS